jgi:hypothetical protein
MNSSASYLNVSDGYKLITNHIINSSPFAFSRFNDGEIKAIAHEEGVVVARGKQIVSSSLKKALIESLSFEQDNYLVGIPCSSCWPKMHKFALKYPREKSLNCMALQNRNYSKFLEFSKKELLNKKNIWIGGDTQSPKNLPFPVFDYKLVEGCNSWRYYKELFSFCIHCPQSSIILISLGPTARVLCQKVFQKRPDLTLIDVGTLFSPYTEDIKYAYHHNDGRPKCKECAF